MWEKQEDYAQFPIYSRYKKETKYTIKLLYYTK